VQVGEVTLFAHLEFGDGHRELRGRGLRLADHRHQGGLGRQGREGKGEEAEGSAHGGFTTWSQSGLALNQARVVQNLPTHDKNPIAAIVTLIHDLFVRSNA